MTYEHGGVGNHFHIVYTDTDFPHSLTTGTSEYGRNTRSSLDRKKDEIAGLKLNLIICEDEFHPFEGKI